MKYLLDTCVLSELIKPKPNNNVINWISLTDEDDLFISVITIGEIQKGISKLNDAKRKTKLQTWLDHDLRNRFENRILTIDTETAEIWGQILGNCEKTGKPIPVIDALISASAIQHDLIVVSRNIQDIAKSSAKILNPWVARQT